MREVAKERHALFVQVVKRVQEDVNLKIEELRTKLAKDVATLDQSYYNLYKKVDIIADVITKMV